MFAILMFRLKIIAFFFSLLVTLQMLPIDQIGKMLVQNQWTEELPHCADEAGKPHPYSNFNHPFLPPVNYTTSNISFISETKALAYIHISEHTPANHSTEVVSPPPDTVYF